MVTWTNAQRTTAESELLFTIAKKRAQRLEKRSKTLSQQNIVQWDILLTVHAHN
jgi:hypothetical protein